LTAIIENNSEKEPAEIRRLVRENVPEYPKRILALVKNIQKAYIDSNGIACLDEQELVFITDRFIEKEKNAMKYENQSTEYMNEQDVPEKLIRFSKEALKFVPKTQVSVVNASLEEFQEVIKNINRIVAEMPLLYAQDGKKNPVVYLHYFHGDQDWYITEKDSEDRQLQAFGNANLGYGGEWGYINIEDFVKSLRVELDFHFEPTPFQQLQTEKQDKQPDFSVGDKVKYQTGDLHPETWYGEIKRVLGMNDIEIYLYRVEAFHLESHMKSLEKHTEVSNGQLTAVAEETYQKHLKVWGKKYLPKNVSKGKAYWEAEIERFELAKKYAFEDKKAYWEAEIKRFKIAQKYAI
jgi:hypothetical protein